MALANDMPRQERQLNEVAQAGLWAGILIMALLLMLGLLLSSAPVFSYAVGLPSTPQLSVGIVEGCPDEVPADICATYRHQMAPRFELALSEDGARQTLISLDLKTRDR